MINFSIGRIITRTCARLFATHLHYARKRAARSLNLYTPSFTPIKVELPLTWIEEAEIKAPPPRPIKDPNLPKFRQPDRPAATKTNGGLRGSTATRRKRL